MKPLNKNTRNSFNTTTETPRKSQCSSGIPHGNNTKQKGKEEKPTGGLYGLCNSFTLRPGDLRTWKPDY